MGGSLSPPPLLPPCPSLQCRLLLLVPPNPSPQVSLNRIEMATVKMESPMTKRCPEEMSTPSSGSKRLRRPVERFEPQELKKGEEQAIYQAIKNSLVETRLMDRLSIPEALILR